MLYNRLSDLEEVLIIDDDTDSVYDDEPIKSAVDNRLDLYAVAKYLRAEMKQMDDPLPSTPSAEDIKPHTMRLPCCLQFSCLGYFQSRADI